MDARLQFEWSGEKAKNFVSKTLGDESLNPGKRFDDLILRDDADYEVVLEIILKHKRKKRKKEVESKGLDL